VSAFSERLARVQARIEAAARGAGRDPASIRLVAVSKTQPVEAVRTAYEAGHGLFGENRAQELVEKADGLGRGPAWHFIGHLQTNKVKAVVDRCSLVHSVDSLRLAEEIGRRSPGRTAVLVQVNTSGETSKAGILPKEALDLCRRIAGVQGVLLSGLMTIPAPTDDPEGARPAFRLLRQLAERGRAEGLSLDELSMGMSDDFEVAIAEGSTLVRIGTMLFGPRS
jgi:PLP dependent protein